jgi:hypothetical protein
MLTLRIDEGWDLAANYFNWKKRKDMHTCRTRETFVGPTVFKMCQNLLDKFGKYRDNKGSRNYIKLTTKQHYNFTYNSSTQAPFVTLQMSQRQSDPSHIHRSTSSSTCLRPLPSCKFTWPHSYRTSMIVQQNGVQSGMVYSRGLLHGLRLPVSVHQLVAAVLQRPGGPIYGTSASWKRSNAGHCQHQLATLMWAFICVLKVLYFIYTGLRKTVNTF